MSSELRTEPKYDAIVAGAGFSGLDALHRPRQLGLRTQPCEAGGGVGGVWFWRP
jgi:cation diffusion facilitator CzcD-associated flavoprotein CzcO